MARPNLRRLTAAVVALGVVVAVVLVGLGVGGGSSRTGRAATSPTTPEGAAAAGGSAAGTVPAGTVPAGASSPTTVASGPPSAGDVAAARACEAFVVYLQAAQAGRVPPAVGSRLVQDASVLLRGARQDQAGGRALPEWAALGSDLLAAAQDVVAKKGAALQSDGAAAGAQCRTVPAAAAAAGGFRRTG